MRRLPLLLIALTAAAPATRPATVRLADARPLADLAPGSLTADLTDKLTPPQATADLYFGTVDQYDGDDDDAKLTHALPILATRTGDDDHPVWHAVPVAAPGLANAGWQYVAAGPRPHEIWAVLDAVTDADAATFTLAHSTDGGATFALTPIDKPCPKATVAGFLLDAAGHGRVTLALDATVGQHRPGLYHYRTADFGRSWQQPPEFEPDAMTPADGVPDDDQPDPPDAHPDGKTRTRYPKHPRRRPPLFTVGYPRATTAR